VQCNLDDVFRLQINTITIMRMASFDSRLLYVNMIPKPDILLSRFLDSPLSSSKTALHRQNTRPMAVIWEHWFVARRGLGVYNHDDHSPATRTNGVRSRDLIGRCRSTQEREREREREPNRWHRATSDDDQSFHAVDDTCVWIPSWWTRQRPHMSQINWFDVNWFERVHVLPVSSRAQRLVISCFSWLTTEYCVGYLTWLTLLGRNGEDQSWRWPGDPGVVRRPSSWVRTLHVTR